MRTVGRRATPDPQPLAVVQNMKELNKIFANNLIRLRKEANLTQLELAEKLNYSDKAVSKWERADAVPDITVLVSISEIFGVTVDYLINEHDENERLVLSDDKRKKQGLLVSLITFMAILTCETVTFLAMVNSENALNVFLFCFVYPMPAWAVLGIVFAAQWGNKLARFLAVTALVIFSALEAFLIVHLVTGIAYPLIFATLIPAELIVVFSFYLSGNTIKKTKKNRKISL